MGWIQWTVFIPKRAIFPPDNTPSSLYGTGFVFVCFFVRVPSLKEWLLRRKGRQGQTMLPPVENP